MQALAGSSSETPDLPFPSTPAAVTVNEFLLRSKRRVVSFAGTIHYLEFPSKFTMQAFRAVAHNVQPAATLRSIRGKGRQDDMSTHSNGTPEGVYVAPTIRGLRQKMENSRSEEHTSELQSPYVI